MKLIPLRTLLLALLLGNGLLAKDKPASKSEQTEPKQATAEEIKARLAEHAQGKEAQTQVETKAAKPAPEAKAKDNSVTVMSEFTVSSSRISELDIKIKKLDKQIKREKKKLKVSDLDNTLNSDSAPKALLIFGGKTAGQRQSVTADRVAFLEAERDILEAMKHVRSKQELDQLETQLNAFKTMSRNLDETLR